MKKNSRNTDALIEKLSSMDDTKNSYKDDRFWRPAVDDAGTGQAIIRFLPEAPGEDTPFVLYYSHGFQGPGGWYIENSRTTLGEKDPVSEMNTRLWNSGDQSKKDQVSQKFKRKKNYVSNVLVVMDVKNMMSVWCVTVPASKVAKTLIANTVVVVFAPAKTQHQFVT